MQLSIYGSVASATVDAKSIWWEQVDSNPNKIAYVVVLFFPSTYVLWWEQVDSNHRPHAYQACALTS